MSNLIMEYRELDRDAAQFFDMLKSARKWELTLFSPDMGERAALENQLAQLYSRVAAIDAPDPVSELLKSHLHDFLGGLKITLDEWYQRPVKHISLFINTFSTAVRKDIRRDEEKATIIMARFKQAQRVWAGIGTWLKDASPMNIQEGMGACRLFIDTMTVEKGRISQYFPALSGTGHTELTDAITQLQALMERWIKEMEEVLAKKGMADVIVSDDDCIGFEESHYRKILGEELGVSLDELLSWHEEEIEKTRSGVFEVAGKLNIPDSPPKTMGDINDLLLKYAGPCHTPEEMFRRGNEYLKRTRDACKDYVWLPDEICELRNVPEQLKVSYPWGGCGNGDPRSRNPVRGEMFLNGYNYKAVTDGWIKMNTVHEAYPGHHVQFVRGAVDSTPETVKLGAKLVPLLEGLCHRSERLFEFVFPEDPFYPLFVAYRRHHTSVRIKVDLTLRYFGKPIKEGVQLYMDELGFDHGTARGQVKAQELMHGYFTCYYYGAKKLEQWENQYKPDPKAYTETIVSAGKLSIDNFHKFLQLNDEQRHDFTHKYASLLQFDENYNERTL